MKHAGRLIFYAALAIGVGIWIQGRRETVLEHNRRVLAEEAAAEAEEAIPEMCANLQPLAERVQAEITSCAFQDDWVTVTLTSRSRDAFGNFLFEVITSGFSRVNTTDKTNYFRELPTTDGRPLFEHTFHLQYKLEQPE